MADPRAESGAGGAAGNGEPDHLVVGQVSKAHGTKGELFVWPLTDRPESVFAPGKELVLGDVHGSVGAEPRKLSVAGSRPFKRGLLVRLKAVDDRDAADVFAGRYLLVPVGSLEPLEEGELYYHQLLGLEVVTTEGEPVGRVREVFETEPAHLLEVKGERVHLIPFSERIVRKVDLDAGRVVIKPPPGLLEL